ncbi:MAG: hypothetical protein HC830_04860, partial [Bacteroidetes bacterium]|nr:hypothetical protein [Bacteroidota bacterium]
MKSIITWILLTVCSVSAAQSIKIKGRILDNHHQPVIGANVYLEGTYDGASTDTSG